MKITLQFVSGKTAEEVMACFNDLNVSFTVAQFGILVDENDLNTVLDILEVEDTTLIFGTNGLITIV